MFRDRVSIKPLFAAHSQARRRGIGLHMDACVPRCTIPRLWMVEVNICFFFTSFLCCCNIMCECVVFSRYGLWNCAIVAQDINLTTRRTLYDKTFFNCYLFVSFSKRNDLSPTSLFFQLCYLVKLLV